MQQLLDVLGLSAQDEDEGIADIVVSDETADVGSVKKSQTVRVHADGTFEVIDTTYETDEDGLTSATVDASGKVGYDALTDEQKEAVSDVAVLKDSGIVLNYSATGELPVSIDMDALGKFIADNEDLISHLVYQTAEFTPEKYDGTVTMDFHFNANDVIDRLGGETKDIVVFEVMSKNAVADEEGSAPVIVASECDLDSEEQTVNLVPTVIGTTATDKSDGDHTLMTKEEILNKIATLTGGRAAEELIFHSITTGASNDIEQATKLARALVTRYGMTEDFDMVALETVNNAYLGGDASLACSEQTAAQVDAKVVEIVQAEHKKAYQLLADNKRKLDEIAQYLYEKETISGEEFMRILNAQPQLPAGPSADSTNQAQ